MTPVGPLNSGALWTLPTLPTQLLRPAAVQGYFLTHCGYHSPAYRMNCVRARTCVQRWCIVRKRLNGSKWFLL